MWFKNIITNNIIESDTAPTKQYIETSLVDGGVIKQTVTTIDTNYILIDDRPEPYENYRLSGTKWVEIIIPIVIPNSVTMFQARKQLFIMGKLDEIDIFVQNSGDRVMQEAWEYAGVFERDNEILNAAATSMGLTQDMIDDFFIEAGKL